jgi:hypothetical protein
MCLIVYWAMCGIAARRIAKTLNDKRMLEESESENVHEADSRERFDVVRNATENRNREFPSHFPAVYEGKANVFAKTDLMDLSKGFREHSQEYEDSDSETNQKALSPWIVAIIIVGVIVLAGVVALIGVEARICLPTIPIDGYGDGSPLFQVEWERAGVIASLDDVL